MTDALNQHLDATHKIGAGVLARLRGWLEARQKSRVVTSLDRDANPCALRPADPASSAEVLRFPIRGDALLIRLAERLRHQVGKRTLQQDPLVLTLSRHPRSRLTIDADTYVEFDPAAAAYRAVFDADAGTRLTIDTADFDTVVRFVVQYLSDRLSDPVTMEEGS